MDKIASNYSQYVWQTFIICTNLFVLDTSQFWLDVNRNIDTHINYSELEEYFKVNMPTNSEKKDSEVTTKKKKEPVKLLLYLNRIISNCFHRFYLRNDH